MYKIGVLAGDGIGPEVVEQGLKVLDACAARFGFGYEKVEYPYGADHYLATGEMLPEHALDEMRQLDAIYLGAIGDERIEVGKLERAIIAGIRFELDLYINLRPIKLYAEHLCPLKNSTPHDVDMVVVRENTEGAYSQIFGFLRKLTSNELSIQAMVNTRMGVERAVRYAFELARQRGKKKKLTLVDKANALRAQDLWSRVFKEVGTEYPDIEQDHAYIDAACMWMIKNPASFDVIVTTNLFGDIITDIGAMIQGGLGVAASGNIHPGKVSMFEPIHGSAPKYRGRNVANPIAAIAAIQMMLDYLGQAGAASAIEGAIERLLVSRRIPDLSASSGLKTSEIGDMVVAELDQVPTGTSA
jgi:3-isopropylmalate dehydrogenase